MTRAVARRDARAWSAGKSAAGAGEKKALARQILRRARLNQKIAEELARGLSLPEIQGISVSGLVDGELRLLAGSGEASSLIRFHKDSIIECLTAAGFVVDRIKKVNIGYNQTPVFAPPPVCRRQPMSAELRRSTLALAKRCKNPRLAEIWRKLADSNVVMPAAGASAPKDR